MDDIDIGMGTPHTHMNLQPGIHNIKLSLPGYKDWIGTVNVIAGSIVSIFENLIQEKA